MPAGTDLSRSNKCHILTLSLFRALNNRHLPARREGHYDRQTGMWHFIIAHSSVGTTPAPSDLVTDLTPWQFPAKRKGTGYLHGTREAVQQTLRRADTEPGCMGLLDITTIATPHTERLLLYNSHGQRISA